MSVILRSEPPGAVVSVDNQPVATTPAVVSLTLPHEVSLTLDGYQPARQVVQSPGEVTVHMVRSRAARKSATLKFLNE